MIEQGNGIQNIGDNSIPDWLFNFFATIDASHPYPSERVGELYRWAMSGDYLDILNGNYPVMDNKELQG
ncbi:hypothetical protein NIES4071_101450 (plasmid) [Calothrix sp. NIES-4071]|nr:hypothetical protein NIES4071_101450 [Calothrix sp. NIES-4071]BAZ64526.1 hypothetical protein NIES4105_102590 [Calothrix sp. NIES-4105]